MTKALDVSVLAGIQMYSFAQGASAFAQRVFEEPQHAHLNRMYQHRVSSFELLWSYYNSSLFEKTISGLASSPYRLGNVYRQNYNLYRNIRLIYNPVRRLVDFYAGQVYPGVLSEDGDELPDGIPLAVPFSEDTPPELKDAVAQFWQWSNWQAKKSVQVRYGAALGSAMIELVDDVEAGKVTADVVWPGFITYLQLDAAGNVKLYIVDYQASDEHGPYFYRKIVNQDGFYYFRNYEPFDYGDGAVVPNPYGFVPAVWIKHIDVGGDFGSPAIAGSLAKVDELNSLASHVHDQVHKKIGAPIVLWGGGVVANLFTKQTNRGATQDFAEPDADQQSIFMLKGGADGHIDHLAGDLNLADAAIYMKELLGEIEQDHPELAFYRELRSMSQVTGPAASRLVGDVASRVAEASANYDAANVSLFRMATAIGGYRANTGDWGTLNRQQQKFLPFNLDSYESGDLDMSIMPRKLLTPTKLETSQEGAALWTGVGLAVKAGVPLEFVLKEEGFTDEEILELSQLKTVAEQKAQAQQDQALALAQARQPQQLLQPQQVGTGEPPMNADPMKGQ